MHNWTKILDFTMKEVAKNYFGKLIIRAHPSNPDISNYIKNSNIQIDRNKNILNTLKKFNPELVIAGDTGLALDLSSYGYKTIILETNNFISLSPFTINKTFKNLFNIDEKKSFEKLKQILSGDKKDVKEYKQYAMQRIFKYSDQAEKKLNNIIKYPARS